MSALRHTVVKIVFAVLLAGLFLTGCATSNVQSRKKERAAGYAALSPEFKALVDEGRIRKGMSQDAVYIAWGKPAQILQQENAQGPATIWLYEGGWMEETRWWPRYARHPVTDYQPRTYVRAEIVFVNSVVDSWRTLPQPVY
jgi:hypothetical protein